ncbi:MAG: HipA N-terminal domain-containing protein [Fluviicola sp.]|jgi:serine/threonine-protein kinase HipA
MKKGIVLKKESEIGRIWEDENGFHFQYNETYLIYPKYGEVSRTLPLRNEVYSDKTILPFFDGLIPEGWFLQLAIENWKLDSRDRMSLLLTLCKDCIGDISIIKDETNELSNLL